MNGYFPFLADVRVLKACFIGGCIYIFRVGQLVLTAFMPQAVNRNIPPYGIKPGLKRARPLIARLFGAEQHEGILRQLFGGMNIADNAV